MAQLLAYLDACAAAVSRHDGAALAALLAVDAQAPGAAVAEALRTQPALDVGPLCLQRLPGVYAEVRAVGKRPLCSSIAQRAVK